MIAAVPSSFRPLDGRLLIGTFVAVRRLSLLGPANKLPFPESLSEGSVLFNELAHLYHYGEGGIKHFI